MKKILTGCEFGPTSSRPGIAAKHLARFSSAALSQKAEQQPQAQKYAADGISVAKEESSQENISCALYLLSSSDGGGVSHLLSGSANLKISVQGEAFKVSNIPDLTGQNCGEHLHGTASERGATPAESRQTHAGSF